MPGNARLASAGAVIRAFACAGALLLAWCGGVASAEVRNPPAGLTCKTDDGGCVVLWLVSQPFALGAPTDKNPDAFDRDFLRDFGGEAEVSRKPVLKEGAARTDRNPGVGAFLAEANGKADQNPGVAWRVIMSGRPIVRPSTNPLENGTVHYMATTVTPAESGDVELTCAYWAEAAVWVNGTKVITGKRQWLDRPSSESAKIAFEKGKQYHILVKLSSALAESFCMLRITAGAGGQRRADVLCSLPVPADQKALASYLPDALNVTIDNYRFFQPDRTAVMFVGLADLQERAPEDAEPHDRAVPPGLDSALTGKVIVRSRDGKELETIKLAKFDPKKLAGKPLTFSYRPRKADTSPFYVVQVEVYLDGVFAGRTERKFYCIEGIQELAGEVQKRAEKFYKERAEDELYEDRDLAYLLLKLEQLKLLYDTESRSYTFGEHALALVLDAQKRVEIMEKRMHPLNPGPGLHEFVYISRVDDSAQPYLVYVPLSYNALKGAPLIVYLHGYDYELNKINWQIIPEGLKQLCETFGYLLVAPFGRSNTDFQGIGEEDVMHVLDLIVRLYNIHQDRIFLAGLSMGGMGAYTIAGHYPDRWAGVVSLAGRADFYMWRKVRPADIQPFKRWLVDLEFADAFAESFRNVPVCAFQGERDSVVEPEQSGKFVKRLTGMEYDATFRPIREDHWISRTVFSTDQVFKWMEDHRRPDAPKRVTFATLTLKYNKAYWVTIDDLRKWGERALIDADVTAPNEITVKQTNVAAFTLQLPEKMIDASKPVVVKAGGKEFRFDAPVKQPLKVVLDAAKPAALHKTPRLCGPIKDVFNSRFIFVYGTQGDPVQNKLLYNHAEMSVLEWRKFVKSVQLLEREKDPLMVRDRDLEPEQKQKCNLVLIGTPGTNSVLAEIAGKLPIKFLGEKGFAVRERRYEGPGLGLNMIYPSPFNPDRYVVVKAGVYYGMNLSENHKFDMLPDYIIYDQSPDREIPDMYDGVPNRSRCAGFFDKYWQVDDNLMWTQPPAFPAAEQ